MSDETIPEVMSEQANMASAAAPGAVGTITAGDWGLVDGFAPVPVDVSANGVLWLVSLGPDVVKRPVTFPAGNHLRILPRRTCICGVSFPPVANAFSCAPVKGPRSPFATRTNHCCWLLIVGLGQRIIISWGNTPCGVWLRIGSEKLSVQFLLRGRTPHALAGYGSGTWAGCIR